MRPEEVKKSICVVRAVKELAVGEGSLEDMVPVEIITVKRRLTRERNERKVSTSVSGRCDRTCDKLIHYLA